VQDVIGSVAVAQNLHEILYHLKILEI